MPCWTIRKRLEVKSERAHHVAPIGGDALWAPRGHPDPINPEALSNAIDRLGDFFFNHVSEWAAGGREGHADNQRILFVVPRQVIDQPEVNYVDS